MIKPGSRQHIAQLIASRLAEPVKPLEPLPSPCEPGFMNKRQAA